MDRCNNTPSTSLKLPLLLLAAAALVSTGCRKSLTLNGQDINKNKKGLITPAVAVAIDLPDGFDTNRAYFQSRSVLTIQIPATTLRVGETFSILNVSAGQTVVDRQSTGGNAALAPGLDLRQTDSTSSALSGYDFILRIYPSDPANAGKLVYGVNNLRLNIEDEQPKSTERTIYLKDYRLMGIQASRFAESVQRLRGFQGEVSFVHNPIISNGHQTITTGLIPNLNR